MKILVYIYSNHKQLSYLCKEYDSNPFENGQFGHNSLNILMDNLDICNCLNILQHVLK